jgi:hypothetical protein
MSDDWDKKEEERSAKKMILISPNRLRIMAGAWSLIGFLLGYLVFV